jgi:hypothetical protein
MSVMSLDQSDSDPIYEDDPISSITINIDNSINVTGNNNTMVLSSSGPSSPTPTNPGTQDASRLSSLAAIIIAALNRANALRDGLGVPRPVNIRINSAIRMEGNNNTMPQAAILKPKREYVDTGVGDDVGDDIAQKRRASSVSTLFVKKVLENSYLFDYYRCLQQLPRLLVAAVCRKGEVRVTARWVCFSFITYFCSPEIFVSFVFGSAVSAFGSRLGFVFKLVALN